MCLVRSALSNSRPIVASAQLSLQTRPNPPESPLEWREAAAEERYVENKTGVDRYNVDYALRRDLCSV